MPDSYQRALTASALGTFLDCSHRSVLDLGAAEGKFERPGENAIERELLSKRGAEHEQRVLSQYRSRYSRVVELSAAPQADRGEQAASDTLAAMEAGADVIYQGTLRHEGWLGRPDFLLKVSGKGGRWPHHYEVVDAKLAETARASAVLQLCVYSDHLARLQRFVPERFYIASGRDAAEPIALRFADYSAYYRGVRRQFEAFLERGELDTYPEPVDHCSVCRWWKRCQDQRRADDHLSLVANITRKQRDRLSLAGVTRRIELAQLREDRRIEGVETLPRLREQARLQVAGPMYRLLLDQDRAQRPGREPELVGLEALPLPKPGDLFLDLEGDAFVGGDGLEYLFGLLELGEPDTDFSVRDAPGEPRYHAYWADSPAAEKRAFEAVIDRILRGREEFSSLHVFHFGHRESDAIKKLSCRHRTREQVVDTLLREHVFVDLYPIVRHGLLAGLEGYTLKQLEALHGFERQTDLREAAQAMQLYGFWLETGEARLPLDVLRERIQAYNRDDCFSTFRLRDFLESLRGEFEKQQGRAARRPGEHQADDQKLEKDDATAEIERRLLAGLPDEPATDTPEQGARRLVANLLEWHWREAKSSYWEYFRALELPPEDRLHDRSVLAGLRYEGVASEVKQSLVHRYSFPEQEHGIRRGPSPLDPDTGADAGSVAFVGEAEILLKRGKRSTTEHPTALIPGRPIETKAQKESLLKLGAALVDAPSSVSRAVMQLLLKAAPAAGQARGASLVREGESLESALSRIALSPEGAVLAVQGPPGSGKTHQAALMILALVRAGKRVGVTANGHSVILNLLQRTVELAGDLPLRVTHLRNEDDDSAAEKWPFEIEKDKQRLQKRLAANELDLIGGTAWLWSSSAFEASVDVLIVDEAGQISLANVLAVARAAQTLVLVGDPAQLEQPQKGVHPPGADLSALDHLLGGNALTIPETLGIFLPDTRRLHPDICNFISQTFYEGRLRPIAGLERQTITSASRCNGAGLRYLAIPHRGNTNRAQEEIEAILALINELGLDREVSASATFTDRHGRARPLTQQDVLVVAPYNAQVSALRHVLPRAIEVGTVDKFQGKEAPIVFYSLTASSADEAPRGLEFLLSPNRFNVAISRAQALSVLVASPHLACTPCKTPRQIRLVNALCAYLEQATPI